MNAPQSHRNGHPMTDLTDLIERVEAAEGPCREIDCRVWCAVGGNSFGHFEVARAVVPDLNQWLAPRYTASLDAAMTLIGDDHFWRVGHDGEGEDPSLFRADIGEPVSIGFVRAVAATPALALVAASLRATRKDK